MPKSTGCFLSSLVCFSLCTGLQTYASCTTGAYEVGVTTDENYVQDGIYCSCFGYAVYDTYNCNYSAINLVAGFATYYPLEGNATSTTPSS